MELKGNFNFHDLKVDATNVRFNEYVTYKGGLSVRGVMVRHVAMFIDRK